MGDAPASDDAPMEGSTGSGLGGEEQPSDPSPAPPPSPAPGSCTDGAMACGKPDGSDQGSTYACASGTWSKVESCEFGCEGGACKANTYQACCDVVKALPSGAKDNFCFAPPGTGACSMTAAGGYCDPNGDASYADGDWNRGFGDFAKYCK